ncbi:DNA polymerase III subunit gamma/tau [Anaerosacchariphilus polymeriproducens]|uniref:DNA-directed DNA polymerase n=1 Tax=Anaerosacchariphilus polymeriproducens TaxID=1812858 RepID=A0A371AV91_9FIRM|nr:DNA polymerase III subunit gamma/tau [Anaerosacchariphilus polymeriproducens]RDU23494.1 DNA polymerase III subunit gamma/tau [Anaerosacchariphilus polymeriproducens]
MSYTALYRKFRPGEFEDVKGQEHIVTTLKNQIKADRIGHAYLFCGTRGTGKTTIAKILAKAVNCESPIDGSPCNECPTCKSINEGTSMNVIEIDAASNNGVDNIREIRDEVTYSPTEGKYKVYIIDEVHMLSIGAFNALLKTLEEPPSYVIFILATTEAHKIPITILSRCQRYDFKRITIETISQRLKDLMVHEQIEVEDKAIRYIAKKADGSMRDALSLLDQCIAFYLGETLTYNHVLEVLGAVDTEVFSKLLRKIIDKDIVGAIEQLEVLIIQGRELGQFIIDFTWYLRNLMLVKNSDDMEDVIDISTENLLQLKEEAEMVDMDTILRFIRIFSDLSNQIKYASQKRVLVEIAIIKLCKPTMENNMDSILERIAQLEKQIDEGVSVQKQFQSTYVESSVSHEPLERPELPKAIPEDIRQVVQSWKSIIASGSGIIKTHLKAAKLSLGGENRLLVVVEDELAEGYLNREEHKNDLEQLIADKVGKEVEVEVRLNQTNRPFEDSFVDIEKLINMDITIEEEEEGGI